MPPSNRVNRENQNVVDQLRDFNGSMQEYIAHILEILERQNIPVNSLPQGPQNFLTEVSGATQENLASVLERYRDSAQGYIDEIIRILTREVSGGQAETRGQMASVLGMDGWPFNTDEKLQDLANSGWFLQTMGIRGTAANRYLQTAVNYHYDGEMEQTLVRERRRFKLEQDANYGYLDALNDYKLAEHTLQNLHAQKRRFLKFLEANDNIPRNREVTQQNIRTLTDQINQIQNQENTRVEPINRQIEEARAKEDAAKAKIEANQESANVRLEALEPALAEIISGFADDKKDAALSKLKEIELFANNAEKPSNTITAEIKAIDGAPNDLDITEDQLKKVFAYLWVKERKKHKDAQRALEPQLANTELANLKNQLEEEEGKLSAAHRRILHEEDINFGKIDEWAKSLSEVDQKTYISKRLSALNEDIKVEEERKQAALDRMNHEEFCEKNPILGKITNFTRSAVDNVLKPTWQEAGKPLLSWSGEKGADALAWTVSKGVPGVVKWWGDRHTRKKDKMERKLEFEKAKTKIKQERQERFKTSLIGKGLSGIGSLAGLGARSTVNVGLAPINAVIGTLGIAASAADGVVNTAASLIGKDGKMNMGGKVKTIPWLRKNAANDNAPKATNDADAQTA